jgi:hypothetical protein
MSHYLSTLCDGCWKVALTAVDALRSGAQHCRACGEPVRVVPGCSYKQSDIGLFTELSQVVADGGIAPGEAQAFAAEISHALGVGSFKACSDTLAGRLPGLLPLQLVTGGNVAGHRVTLQTLRTIFEGLATLQRQSVVHALGARPQAHLAEALVPAPGHAGRTSWRT